MDAALWPSAILVSENVPTTKIVRTSRVAHWVVANPARENASTTMNALAVAVSGVYAPSRIEAC